MKLLAVGYLLSLALTTVAAAPTPTTPSKPMEFDTETEAAVHALQYVARISEGYEYGGVIAKLPDGKFGVGVPTTDYRGDGVNIDEDPDDYGGQIVASFHTHPCLPESHVPDYFSPQDLKSARTNGHDAYMGDLCTGDVHLWHPGDPYDPPPKDLGLAALLAPPMAKGKIVGHIAVTHPKPLENISPGHL